MCLLGTVIVPAACTVARVTCSRSLRTTSSRSVLSASSPYLRTATSSRDRTLGKFCRQVCIWTVEAMAGSRSNGITVIPLSGCVEVPMTINHILLSVLCTTKFHPDSPGFTWINPGFTLSQCHIFLFFYSVTSCKQTNKQLCDACLTNSGQWIAIMSGGGGN